jgi:hypothetical protein
MAWVMGLVMDRIAVSSESDEAEKNDEWRGTGGW